MPEEFRYKPNSTAFLKYGFAIIAIVFVILYIIVLSLVGTAFLLPISAVLLVLLAIAYWIRSVNYDKEEYIFSGDRLVRKSGSPFSDNKTELIIRNITHVKLSLPWIEYALFKTGSIRIESAGSAATEISLNSVDGPEKFYEKIREMMKEAGFSLSMKKTIQVETPNIIGVFLEVIGGIIGTIIIGLWIFGVVLAENEGGWDFLSGNMPILTVIIVLVVVGLVIRSILQFLDLSRRVYTVYEDTIAYKEGFMSKHYAFIPIENLADSEVTQHLIGMILGIYDVKLSCQGAGKEILFKNMVHGKEMEAKIDELIAKMPNAPKEKAMKATSAKPSGKELAPKKIKVDTAFTSQFRMDMARSIAPIAIAFFIVLFLSFIFPPLFVITFLVLIGGIFLTIGIAIKVACTKYLIKSTSFQSDYAFLSTKVKEFTNDKITGIVYKRNFIDNWFNTATIELWSIGSGEAIKFENIKVSPELLPKLLSKIGIYEAPVAKEMWSEFTFERMLKSSLPAIVSVSIMMLIVLIISLFFPPAIIAFIGLLILISIIVLSGYLYKNEYYKRSVIRFYSDYIHCKHGLLFVDNFYARYRDVKGLHTRLYPYLHHGSLKFDIAGEQSVKDQKGNQTGKISNNFQINYMPQISTQNILIDEIIENGAQKELIQRIEKNIESYKQRRIFETKPNPLAASFIVALILGILVLISSFVLVVVYPALIVIPVFIGAMITGFVYWSAKVTSYSIEEKRVAQRFGILYKNQRSILFDKIDHINYHRGIIDKLFGTGSVIINTTASTSPEMIASYLPNYLEFYEELKKHY